MIHSPSYHAIPSHGIEISGTPPVTRHWMGGGWNERTFWQARRAGGWRELIDRDATTWVNVGGTLYELDLSIFYPIAVPLPTLMAMLWRASSWDFIVSQSGTYGYDPSTSVDDDVTVSTAFACSATGWTGEISASFYIDAPDGSPSLVDAHAGAWTASMDASGHGYHEIACGSLDAVTPTTLTSENCQADLEQRLIGVYDTEPRLRSGSEFVLAVDLVAPGTWGQSTLELDLQCSMDAMPLARDAAGNWYPFLGQCSTGLLSGISGTLGSVRGSGDIDLSPGAPGGTQSWSIGGNLSLIPPAALGLDPATATTLTNGLTLQWEGATISRVPTYLYDNGAGNCIVYLVLGASS